jgi:uncharacterized membrane protein
MINSYPVLMMAWNIFLALIPCWVAYGMLRKKISMKSAWFWPLFIIWFFFFPNTAYLFTMVRHLLNHCVDYNPLLRVCTEESWMVMFFFGYALIGLPTFYYALKKMTHLVGRCFPLVMIPFTSIGVLFGLVERFNSWDVIRNPMMIVQTGFSYFIEPDKILNLIVFTIVFYFIYYMTDYFIERA